MQQLLQIETVPIKLKVKSTRARFEISDTPEITDNMNSSVQNIKTGTLHNVDTGTAAGRASSDVYVNDKMSYGQMMSYEVYGKENAYRDSMTPSSSYISAAIRNAQIEKAASAEYSADQQVFAADNMQAYAMDRASFEMNVGFGLQNLEFVPASIEFIVDQRPEVKIEYIGKPIYVPRSADPNYVDITA